MTNLINALQSEVTTVLEVNLPQVDVRGLICDRWAFIRLVTVDFDNKFANTIPLYVRSNAAYRDDRLLVFLPGSSIFIFEEPERPSVLQRVLDNSLGRFGSFVLSILEADLGTDARGHR